jgi:hypothetical protein
MMAVSTVLEKLKAAPSNSAEDHEMRERRAPHFRAQDAPEAQLQPDREQQQPYADLA